MQIISDTHGSHYGVKVPEGDVLIHCGDVCSHGSMVDTLDFLRWFNTHPHPHKIFVAGNHDIIFEKDPGLIQTLLKQFPDIHYLEDSGVTIDGLKFWGSPYTPRFFNWSFNADRGEDIKRHWDMIPEGTDVLITHGPPYNICDEAPRVGMARATEHVGCKDLLDATLRVAPKLHAFGHIHYSGGKSYVGPKITFANVSLLNEGYVIEYPPMVFDIDFEGTVSIV